MCLVWYALQIASYNIKLSINYIILFCFYIALKDYNGNSVVGGIQWPLGFTDSLGSHFTPGGVIQH